MGSSSTNCGTDKASCFTITIDSMKETGKTTTNTEKATKYSKMGVSMWESSSTENRKDWAGTSG